MDRQGSGKQIQVGASTCGVGESLQDPQHIARDRVEKMMMILERIRSPSGKELFKEDSFEFESRNDGPIWRESHKRIVLQL